MLSAKLQIDTISNGCEFAAHKLITKYLGAVIYFADPYASRQKGAIENTNKLIRQYIPKQANFGLMVKCTPERGHNALFFIPLEVIIML